MTTHLFPSSTTTQPVLLFKSSGFEYSYEYDAEKRSLCILRGKKVIDRQEANPGDAFFCGVKDNVFQMNQLKFPRKRSDLVAWAIGCPREFRATCPEDFARLHQANLAAAAQKNIPVTPCYLSDNTYYYFSLCTPNASTKATSKKGASAANKSSREPVRLAAYISDEITPQATYKLFSAYLERNSFNFPISFFSRICLRLGLSKNDIARLTRNKEKHFSAKDVVLPIYNVQTKK